MPAVPQPDPSVVTAAMPGGDTVLVHLGTGQYFCLNETGTFLWNLLAGSATRDRMSQALFDAFDITPEAASEAVAELMQDLKTHRLITIREPRLPLS
jgi:hypothetical protein